MSSRCLLNPLISRSMVLSTMPEKVQAIRTCPTASSAVATIITTSHRLYRRFSRRILRSGGSSFSFFFTTSMD